MKARRVELVSESRLQSQIDPDGGWVATTAEADSVVDAHDPMHGHLFETNEADSDDMSESPVEIDEVALRRSSRTS